MKRDIGRLLIAVVAFVSAALAENAHATAQRTFVASSGLDVNVCSVAAPCRTFAAAIANTSVGGEVIVLDSAAYGPVTIAKSVSLVAPTGIYAGITVFTGDGITVDAPAATVVLRGLSISGQGGANGINLLQAARLRIEGCVISNMGVDGIMHSASGAELIVLDTIVRDNGASGIGGDANASVLLDHVRSEHNGTHGFYLAALNADATATITDSVFAFNGSNGIWVAATGNGHMSAQVERSVMSSNGNDGMKISGTTGAATYAAVIRNSIHRNGGQGVRVLGTGAYNFSTVSENAIGGSDTTIGVDGPGATVYASANHLSESMNFMQSNSARFYSYGNNTGGTLYAGTILPASGD